jgi:hypothetical protein
MQILFDKYDLYETPSFILCNTDGSELYSLGGIYDRKYKPRYNSLSELTFTAPYKTNNIVNEYYIYLVYRRLVYLEDFGYFMITNVEETNDGITREKEITCQSLEVELSLKKITDFSGTYQFYDIISPSATLMGKILTYLPGWSIGTIDSDLLTLYRTFDVSDSTIYNFLMTEVEDSYQCVFSFDYLNKTISAYAVENAITPTDIYLSYDNIIEKLSIKEISDELCTALTVKGAGDLSINQVNPLGTDVIYNFSYFKTTDWMSQTLIDAITAWENRILEKQEEYANLLTSLKEANEQLNILESELTDLEAEMDALEGVRAVRIQQGLNYSDINSQIAAKQLEIDSKQAEIDSVNATIGNPLEYTTITRPELIIDPSTLYPDVHICETSAYYSGSSIYYPPEGSLLYLLQEINTYVSFEENFTEEQLTFLSGIVLGNTYNNENFIQTDIMTQSEIQDQAQEFSVDGVNFVFLKEFQTFIDQLELGASVTLELEEDLYVYPVLLGIDLDYDNPSDFSLIFGNRLRLDDSSYIFSDLFGQTVRQGITTSFNGEQWGNWNTNYKDDVSTFINSSLDASRNAVISGSTQNVLINQNGLRGRSMIGTDSYSPEQVWLINNMLAFTDDNWTTAKLALGKISTSSGSAFGLAGEVIVGNILAGNNLTITNESNTFNVNGNGATLTNATLTVNTTSGKTKIFLDPTNGIKIQGLVGGSWQDKFYADSNGNVIFSGNLSGATGTFSGNLSAATITGGTITGTTINGGTINGATGYFSGNVYAANLQGLVTSDQINSLLASKVAAGTMSNVNLSGGRGSITVGGAGQMLIAGTNGISMTDSFLISIVAPTITFGSSDVTANNLTVGGYDVGAAFSSINNNITTIYSYTNQLWSWRNSGKNITLTVSTPYGNMNMTFTYGLLTNYYYV